jgi:hydrogenase maturation protease
LAAEIISVETMRQDCSSLNVCRISASRLLGQKLAGDADLIIIDAVVRGAAVGTIHLWHGIPPVSNRVAMSSHGMGLGEAMRLAKTLGRLPNTLRVYGIEGKTFEIGSPVSYEVHESVETLAWQIKAEIEIKTSGQTI